MDRGSQLDEEDEEDEDEAGGGSGRQERKAGAEGRQEATDIKSNNPHLAGGEKQTPVGFGGSFSELWVSILGGSPPYW